MLDRMQAGQAWLAAQLNKHASQTVVYRRGELVAELQATIGESTYQQDDGAGSITRAQVRDYLIDTGLLVLDGIATLPKAGDKIIETEGQKQFTYEVMSLGSDTPWRYSDPFRLKLRIHTKLISTEDVN